jgi:hypothetical protein
MKKFIALCLVIVILAAGFPLSSFSAAGVEVRGNSPGNIANGASVAENDKYILFSASGEGLYRTDKSNGETIKISNYDASCINIVGDYFYCTFSKGDLFSNEYKGLYRAKLDGSEVKKLSSDNALSLNVVGDWIYYINEGDKIKPYKMKLDGSGKVKISDEMARSMVVSDGWIYFKNYSKNVYLYKMKINGSELTQISKQNIQPTNIVVIGDWIYYTADSPQKGIYRIKTDGTANVKLYESDITIFNMNIQDGYIYFTVSGSLISRMKTDGTDLIKLNNVTKGTGLKINIADGWIYYFLDNTFKRIKLDGSGEQDVGTYTEQFEGTLLFPMDGDSEDDMLELPSDVIVETPDVKIIVNGMSQKFAYPVICEDNVYLAEYSELLHGIGIPADSLDSLSIGSKTDIINGNVVRFEVPPQTYKDAVYVPIKTIAECFGRTVEWDETTKTMSITYKIPSAPKYWTYMKDRPSGNSSIDIKMKSTVPGIDQIGIRSGDANKAVAYGGKIYMVDNNGTLKEYDPVKDAWKNKLVIAGVKNSNGIFKLVVIKDKLYVVGLNYKDVLEYDFKTNKSGIVTQLPVPWIIGAAVAANGRLYVLSGSEAGNIVTLNTIYEYDPLTRKWTRKADMHEGAGGLSAAALNNSIYVFGALSEQVDGQNVEVYDIHNNKWSYMESGKDTYAIGAEFLNGKLYTFRDGVDDKGVLAYDPKTSTWKKVAEQPELGYDFATVALNGSIFVVTGSKVYKFTPPKK